MALIKIFADTNIGLRDNNEDNYAVCPDLTLGQWEVPDNTQIAFPLGRNGCLMVVADGMGGMNAGEVASDIAIRTVQEMFAPSVLASNVTFKQDNVKTYLKKVIVEADRRVKQYAKDNPETKGMGSTIVMAWLIGSDAYIGWLGDSRAYSYVPEKGIARLSKDHSYVQELVDAKQLTEEEAMNHDMSNVITRSLGDTSQKAKPDVTVHRVCEGEIIMLCSDGLCGVCTDEEISSIIEQNAGSLPQCQEALTEAALNSGGSDNITIALLNVTEVPRKDSANDIKTWLRRMSWKEMISGAAIVLIAIGLIFTFISRKANDEEVPIPIEKIELHLSKNTLNYGDTLNYEVTILPKYAHQYYSIECKSGKLAIDSVGKKIFLKDNSSGIDSLIVISKADSLKRHVVCITYYKKEEESEDVTTKSDIVNLHDGTTIGSEPDNDNKEEETNISLSLSPEEESFITPLQ